MGSFWHKNFVILTSKITSQTARGATLATCGGQWCSLECYVSIHFLHIGGHWPVCCLVCYHLHYISLCCQFWRCLWAHFYMNLTMSLWFRPLCSHYVMGGGWDLFTQMSICKRIRGDRYRGNPHVTLPYLTLRYVTLPYLKLNILNSVYY